jgi:predicted transposase YdaD
MAPIMSTQLGKPHDAFFKQVLSDTALAGTFLREHLPPEVAALLDVEPPELVPGSFVDEELRQHHTDLLFRVHLKVGPDAFAYVLMEHKSHPDPGARLQLLLRHVPEKQERIMGWLTQPYYDMGKAEGKAEGRAEGAAELLSRVLQQRFGALPDSLRKRICGADVKLIDQWAERVFTAPDLQSVFEAN